MATVLLQATRATEYNPTNLPPWERWPSTKLSAKEKVAKDHSLKESSKQEQGRGYTTPQESYAKQVSSKGSKGSKNYRQ